MGKPFKKELGFIFDTIQWVCDLDVSELRCFFEINKHLPLLAIGSGGSFSACHYAALLYENLNTVAKAITPFDYIYSTQLIENSKSLFISASGKNNDILISAKKAILHNAAQIANLSVRYSNPLRQEIESCQNGFSINYELPTGKDGFLATNSLMAFFGILYRSLCTKDDFSHLLNEDLLIHMNNDFENFSDLVRNRNNFTVLYGGWGLPVAYDIESKFTEAALGAVQLTDYRNFGHGRHHWFDKHKDSSCIIALVTPKEKYIAEKTLSLIPNDIPRCIIESNYLDALSSLDLLIKAFHLVSAVGDVRGIDPGKPGVPDFGRKLYHLKYASLYKDHRPQNNREDIYILRKAHVNSKVELSEIERGKWQIAYNQFRDDITTTSFSGIILDYDGTICSSENRYQDSLEESIKSFLIDLLKHNIKIGVVTGRGGSLKSLFRNSIPKVYWDKVYIGYYNGAECGTLNDDLIPDSKLPINNTLQELHDNFFNTFIVQENDFEKIDLRPFQLTIRAKNRKGFDFAKNAFQNMILQKGLSCNVCILESSHSLDIILRPNVSKLNLIERFFNKETFLCIGDKGLVPGNDFELLSCPYSLSVDEVSYNPSTCWNLSPEGMKNLDAMLYYISMIKIEHGNFKISFDK